MSYGISFWIVPSLSACGAVVATELGDPTRVAWFVSLYTVSDWNELKLILRC